jgi:hypothetical protein
MSHAHARPSRASIASFFARSKDEVDGDRISHGQSGAGVASGVSGR